MNFFTLVINNISCFKKFKLTVWMLIITANSFSQVGWVQVPSPDTSTTRNMLRGISGTSSSDVWAVGTFEETLNVIPYTVEKDFIMHWNGSAWKIFPPLDLSTTLDDLWDVEALGTGNVWAVGTYNAPGTSRAELLHYNGSSWSNQALPFITGGSFLFSLDAISATDIWAVGGQAGSPTNPCYTIHYNGSSWTEKPVPPVGLYHNLFNAVDALTSNDVWAVGYHGDFRGDYHTLAMHWNGSVWSNFPLPAAIESPLGELANVVMISTNDVWAVGSTLTGVLIMVHWDGTSWSQAPHNGGGGAFAPLASNNLFAVGAEISHWNGNTWTVVDSLKQLTFPSLVTTKVFTNGEIWAAGRTVDANNNFHSLVYRSVNNVPVFKNGSSQNWNTLVNSGNNSIDSLLKIQDADVRQILTYSIVSLPNHGTVNGFPDTAITNNGLATPSGLTYTPSAFYSGTDQFIIRVSAGSVSTQTTINVNVAGTLPVTLLYFNVSKQSGNTLLKWSTSSEINMAKFVIEHSSDGTNFIPINTVTAHGNTNTESLYSTIHHFPNSGINYYRLKSIDRDRRILVYPVKAIQFDARELRQISIYPNPIIAKQFIVQMATPGNYLLNLYNEQGQKVFTQTINNTFINTIILPPYLVPGIYNLSIKNGKSKIEKSIVVL